MEYWKPIFTLITSHGRTPEPIFVVTGQGEKLNRDTHVHIDGSGELYACAGLRKQVLAGLGDIDP